MNVQFNSLPYYHHNAHAYFERTRLKLDLAALREFTNRIPANGRILDVGCGSGRDLKYFTQNGFVAEGVDGSSELVKLAKLELSPYSVQVKHSDLMLLSLPKETYDGIWAHRTMIHFSADGCRRVMANFFSALKPKGFLFVSFEEGSETREDRKDDPVGPSRMIYQYRVDDFSSLVRQHGFEILCTGKEVENPNRIGIISRRI